MSIHNNFNKLTTKENQLVEYLIHQAFAEGSYNKIRLCGDDRVEHVVEAIATWIIESR